MQTELDGAMVFAKDFRRMQKFYSEVLGLTALPTDHPGEYLQFDTGPAKLALHKIPDHVAASISIDTPPRVRDEGAIKFILRTSDIGEVRSRLSQSGASPGPECENGSLRFFDCVDPQGNVFQVVGR